MTEIAPALATTDEARELLGDEFDDLVSSGGVRRVKAADGTRFVGADIDKALRQRDPRHCAAVAYGEATDDDDKDSPRSLAARHARLNGGRW